jgi:hypothetical protein
VSAPKSNRSSLRRGYSPLSGGGEYAFSAPSSRICCDVRPWVIAYAAKLLKTAESPMGSHGWAGRPVWHFGHAATYRLPAVTTHDMPPLRFRGWRCFRLPPRFGGYRAATVIENFWRPIGRHKSRPRAVHSPQSGDGRPSVLPSLISVGGTPVTDNTELQRLTHLRRLARQIAASLPADLNREQAFRAREPARVAREGRHPSAREAA